MHVGRARPPIYVRLVPALLGAALLLVPLDSGASPKPPKGFPRATFVTGQPVVSERTAKAVLLHAQWVDDSGEPQKYFRGDRRFPWPRPLPVSDGAFRVRLDGVAYPGTLQVGVFRRTGPRASPAGRRDIYNCTVDGDDSACRWIPNVVDGKRVWEVAIDHDQAKGHMYVVAVGSWDDPRDPPKPVGTRGQIATWIMHARIAPAD